MISGNRAQRRAGGLYGRQAMKAVVRTLERTDLEGFDRLRSLLYPDRPDTFDTDRYFSIWHWLGTHPLADQMQRWVVATEEGEVVGHLAALPQYYRIKGQIG